MKYIYDIILNFQKNYYQFFEWSPKDKIINISKAPLFRVSNKDIIDLKENEIIVNKEFIKKIPTNNPRKNKICIVSNNKIAIALLFNNEGYLLKRSSLIFEEEEEAISLAKNLNNTSIYYQKNSKIKVKNALRITKEKKDTIISYIKNTDNILNLKYIYYECFEKEINNKSLLKKALLNELSKEWNHKQSKLYKIINILSNSN